MKHLIFTLLISMSAIYVKAQIVIPLILPNSCSLSTGIDKIQNLEQTATLKLFPNPTDGAFSLTIESATLIGEIGIEIFNSSGTECYSIPAFCNFNVMVRQIDAAHLPNGVYFLRVISENTELTSSFVIQK